MAVAAQAGTAITNARLMAEARRWAKQLEGIEALSRQLNRSREVAGVGEAVARELDSLMPYDGLRFYVLEPDGRTLEAVTLKTSVPEYADETPGHHAPRPRRGAGRHHRPDRRGGDHRQRHGRPAHGRHPRHARRATSR